MYLIAQDCIQFEELKFPCVYVNDMEIDTHYQYRSPPVNMVVKFLKSFSLMLIFIW